MQAKTIIQIGALLAMLGVVFGAFGAHALEAKLSAEAIDTFQTGVLYQFLHAFALLFLGLWQRSDGQALSSRSLSGPAWCFALGILFFSGSLYLLSTRPLHGLAVGFLGPITPIGGTLFIIGWALTIRATSKL